MRDFIALDAEWLESRRQGGEVVEALAERWRRELDELDRLVGSQVGRSDSFAKRLRASRR